MIGEAQTKAELEMAETEMHTLGTTSKQIRRTPNSGMQFIGFVKVKRTRTAGVARFLERHVQEMEEQLRWRHQRGFFQHLKPMKVEESRKVESQCIHDDDGRLLRIRISSLKDGRDSFNLC